MADEDKLLNEFKQDLLGFTSKLSHAFKNHPDMLKDMLSGYEQLFRSSYQQVADLKQQIKLETKAAMKSGVVHPSPFDSDIAKQIEKNISKENRKNTQQETELDITPKSPRPGKS